MNGGFENLNGIEKLLLAHESPGFCYNTGVAVEFATSLNLVRLKAAVDSLLMKIPVLRSKIDFTGEPSRSAGDSEQDRSQCFKHYGSDFDAVERDFSRPMNLSDRYPIVVGYAENEQRSQLSLLIHHSGVDGVSLIRTLGELLHAYAHGAPSNIDCTRSVRTTQRGLISLLCSPRFLPVIRSSFHKRSAATLSNWPIPEGQNYQFDDFRLDPKVVEKLKASAKKKGVSFFAMTADAALQALHAAVGTPRSAEYILAFPADLRPTMGTPHYFGNLVSLFKVGIQAEHLTDGSSVQRLARKMRKIADPKSLSLAYDLLLRLSDRRSFSKWQDTFLSATVSPKKISSSLVLSYVRFDRDLFPKDLTPLRLRAFSPTFKSPGLGLALMETDGRYFLSVNYDARQLDPAKIRFFLESLHSRLGLTKTERS